MCAFRLPPANHRARTMFDMATIVDALSPANRGKIPTFDETFHLARCAFATNHKSCVQRICYVCLRADDAYWLISVGPRGGWRMEWNFGKAG